MRNLLPYLIVVILLTSCAKRQAVQVVTEYAVIPGTFQTIPIIPPVPVEDTVSVGDGITLANNLRSAACIMRSRYRELLRYATQGNVVLPDATQEECPK